MTNTTKTDPEIVARRETFDGVKIFLHADGAVSCRTHFIGRVKLPADQMWRVVDDMSIYTFAELPGLIRSVRSGEWQKSRERVSERAAAAARNRAVPESDRLYVGKDLANGTTVYWRVR